MTHRNDSFICENLFRLNIDLLETHPELNQIKVMTNFNAMNVYNDDSHGLPLEPIEKVYESDSFLEFITHLIYESKESFDSTKC